MVNVILAFDSALAYWSNAGARMSYRYLPQDTAEGVLASSHGAIRARAFDRLRSASWLGALRGPLDVLVPSANDCHASSRIKFHCWQTKLPAGAFVPLESACYSVGDELYNIVVSSPEFCFLQMAQVMDDVELTELGFELCGTYAINPEADRGLVKRMAVTTPKRLASFCQKASGMTGIQRARRAAKWVLANSRSPRESQTAMLATLPRSRGGFGLRAPLLNHELELPLDIARTLGVPKIYPDMYWEGIRTVLEYDSRDWHDDYEAAEHDALKRTAYRLLKLDVVTLTKGHFENLHIMEREFDNLARRMRIVRKPPTSEQLRARAALHRQLVSGERRERVVLRLEPSKLPQVPYGAEVEIPW